MVEIALKDLNTLPISERKNESSTKGGFTKPYSEHILDERNKKNTAPLVETSINGDESLKSGAEVVNTEVEYIESENLNDVEDVDMSFKEGVHLLISPHNAWLKLLKYTESSSDEF
ncbi:hypothetical protein LOK49_Contig58G00018 [Camellia lanceoleosa]|nr:hypothetical protein LOK49_Contig58G00018 [Camellia lanceoleosa]